MNNFDNVRIPKGEILNMEFLTKDEFYPMEFGGRTYTIFTKDQFDMGIFLGVSEDGAVFNINTDENTAQYVMNSLKNFIKGIRTCQRLEIMCCIGDFIRELKPFRKLPENDNRAKKLWKVINRLDPKALEKDTFWSAVIEEMGYGII